jgi:hypothetical protein
MGYLAVSFALLGVALLLRRFGNASEDSGLTPSMRASKQAWKRAAPGMAVIAVIVFAAGIVDLAT